MFPTSLAWLSCQAPPLFGADFIVAQQPCFTFNCQEHLLSKMVVMLNCTGLSVEHIRHKTTAKHCSTSLLILLAGVVCCLIYLILVYDVPVWFMIYHRLSLRSTLLLNSAVSCRNRSLARSCQYEARKVLAYDLPLFEFGLHSTCPSHYAELDGFIHHPHDDLSGFG